jgi:hypothetical protein
MTLRRSLLSAPLLLTPLLALQMPPAQAQGAPPSTRLRGTIASISGDRLTVAPRDGGSTEVALAENLVVSARKRVELSSIKPGDYLGIAAAPGPGGAWQAIEVVVFPEALRGIGEGHYAWDLAPGTSMTNATVAAAVEKTQGRELVMNYRGGSTTIQVPAEASVVTPIPAARSDLVPGAQVVVQATRDASGALTTSRITVSKDGVMLPM